MDNKLEKRYKKYREILKNLTIMSDIFMRNVFKDRFQRTEMRGDGPAYHTGTGRSLCCGAGGAERL